MALTKVTGNLIGTETVTNNNISDSVRESFGPRNRIINGDMRIDQRNAGAAVTLTSGGDYTVDRFKGFEDTDGAMTAQQDSSAPAGFVNSTKLTTTTADGTLGASQFAIFRQGIEGTNIADLAWGTANAKTVTLSFFVRSSLTGTFGGAINNNAFNRGYPFTYSISVADTWEYKTIEIEGDVTGTWLTTTDTGMNVDFGLGVGSANSGTADAWAGSGFLSATGAVSVIGTLNATWFVTGVQLEVGEVATPFERRPFGTELILCQRYFTKFGSSVAFVAYSMGEVIGTTSIRFLMQCPVVMRSSPTLSVGGSGLVWSLDRVGTPLSSFSLAQATTQIQSITASTLNGITIGQVGSVTAGNFTDTSVSFSSEL